MKKIFLILIFLNILNASYVIKPQKLVEINTNNLDEINLRFNNLKNNIFKIIAPDIQNIVFKKSSNIITSDLKLFKEIDNINLIWLLPDEFSDFINENYEIFAMPKENLNGEFSVILRVVKNNQVIKEEAISTDFKILIKN